MDVWLFHVRRQDVEGVWANDAGDRSKITMLLPLSSTMVAEM